MPLLPRPKRGYQARGSFDPAPSGGGGPVTFDTSGFYSLAGAASTTSQTFASVLTVGSGSSRALLAFLFFAGNNAGAASSPTLTWNGTSMTLLGGPYADGSIGDIYVFGLVAPASGANNFVANWTGAAQAGLAAISVTGADQTGGATTFHNIVTGTAPNPPQVTTIVTAGELAAAAYASDTNFTATGTGTDIGNNNNNNLWAIAANYTTTSGSQLLSYNPNGSYIAVAASIKSA